MNLECQSCGAEYRIDDAKIPSKGGVITCKSCGAKIRVPPPGSQETPIALAGSDTVASPEPPPEPPTPTPAATPFPASSTPSFASAIEDTSPNPPASDFWDQDLPAAVASPAPDAPDTPDSSGAADLPQAGSATAADSAQAESTPGPFGSPQGLDLTLPDFPDPTASPAGTATSTDAAGGLDALPDFPQAGFDPQSLPSELSTTRPDAQTLPVTDDAAALPPNLFASDQDEQWDRPASATDNDVIPLVDDDDIVSLEESPDLPAPLDTHADLPAALPESGRSGEELDGTPTDEMPTLVAPPPPGLSASDPGDLPTPASFDDAATTQSAPSDLPASYHENALGEITLPGTPVAELEARASIDAGRATAAAAAGTEAIEDAFPDSDSFPPLGGADALPPLGDDFDLPVSANLPAPDTPDELASPDLGAFPADATSPSESIAMPDIELEPTQPPGETYAPQVSTDIPLQSGLPEAPSPEDAIDVGFPGDLPDAFPAVGSELAGSADGLPADIATSGLEFDQAPVDTSGFTDTLEPSGATGPGPVPSSELDSPVDDSAAGRSGSSRGRVIVAALAAVVLAVAGVAVFAPELLPFRVSTLTGGSETDSGPAAIDAEVTDNKATEGDNDKPAADSTDAQSDKDSETAKPAPAPALTASNVHALAFGQLRASTEKYASSGSPDPGLLGFAYFRLAHTFGDAGASAELTKRMTTPVNPRRSGGELELAAGLGALLVNGKANQAKRIGERALRGPFQDSALIEYVTGVAYEGKPPAKALRHLERAVELDEGLVDARLARAALLLRKRGAAEEAEAALQSAVQTAPGPAIAVRAAKLLLDNDRFQAIEAIDDPLLSSTQAEQIAPADQPPFFRLLIAKNTREGNFGAGAEAAKRWAQLDRRPEPLLAEARLTAANGGEPSAVLRAGLETVESGEERGQLLYELGRLALGEKPPTEPEGLSRAESIIAELRTLPAREAGGWLKLLEGDIARVQGQTPKARAAYAASGRGRPRFVEPRLASLQTDADKRGPNLNRLNQLERRAEHPAVTWALAEAMSAKGDAAGAAELFDKALWMSPPPRDTLLAVLAWTEALAAAGAQQRAYDKLTEIQKTHPDDVRVLEALVRLSGALSKSEDAVTWHEALVEQKPDDPSYRLAYASALNDADRSSDAITVLDELHKEPANKSARSLAELGRAYLSSDEVKARSLLNEAKNLEPSSEIYTLLGRIEAKQQRYDTAMENYQEALKLSGGDHNIRRELGLLQLQRGNPRDAVENLKLVLKREPGDREAALSLGDALSSVGKHREALQVYQRTNRASPNDPELLMRSALIQLQQLDQTQPAIRAFRRIVELEPENAQAHYYLGYAYKDLGRTADARQQLQSFLKKTDDKELAAEVNRDLEDL
ncbi:MAG: tetratricopeptide repeat protein [Myxococcota bacterium]